MKAIDILKELVAEQVYSHDDTEFKPKYVWVSSYEEEWRSTISYPEADGGCCSDTIAMIRGDDPKKVLDKYYGQDEYRIIDGYDTPWGTETKWVRVDADIRWYDEDADIELE
jgi:hypothetical protein